MFKLPNEQEYEMKSLYRSTTLTLITILALLVTPAFAVQNGPVTASAVVVPAQITRLSFLSSGLVKEVTVKEGDSVSTGGTLAVLNTPDLEFNVTAAQEAFHSAEANATLQRYKRVKDRRNGKVFWDVVPPEIRQIADAKAASAQAGVEVAQAMLAQSTLISPADATVASVDVFPGEYIDQNQTIITLASLDKLQLETTDLSERDITKVKVGAQVTISIEALNETFHGKVLRISPMASTLGGDTVFKVTIAFDEQPKGLLWGMTAEVTIE
jgi:RND family efflux transporter MFP subunit